MGLHLLGPVLVRIAHDEGRLPALVFVEVVLRPLVLLPIDVRLDRTRRLQEGRALQQRRRLVHKPPIVLPISSPRIMHNEAAALRLDLPSRHHALLRPPIRTYVRPELVQQLCGVRLREEVGLQCQDLAEKGQLGRQLRVVAHAVLLVGGWKWLVLGPGSTKDPPKVQTDPIQPNHTLMLLRLDVAAALPVDNLDQHVCLLLLPAAAEEGIEGRGPKALAWGRLACCCGRGC